MRHAARTHTRGRSPTPLLLAVGLALLALALPAHAQQLPSDVQVSTGSGPHMGTYAMLQCSGGANDGKPCATGGDCSGGSCQTRHFESVVLQGIYDPVVGKITLDGTTQALFGGVTPCSRAQICIPSSASANVEFGPSGFTSRLLKNSFLPSQSVLLTHCVNLQAIEMQQLRISPISPKRPIRTPSGSFSGAC